VTAAAVQGVGMIDANEATGTVPTGDRPGGPVLPRVLISYAHDDAAHGGRDRSRIELCDLRAVNRPVGALAAGPNRSVAVGTRTPASRSPYVETELVAAGCGGRTAGC
jgi:hypothetical protein